jgi:protein involved in polysaccharide export with SLBB domain
MTTHLIKLFGTVSIVVLLTTTMHAENMEPASRRKEREQFQMAEESANAQLNKTANLQRSLDTLQERKDYYQQQADAAKLKAQLAHGKQLAAATSASTDDVEKFRADEANWDARYKVAVTELEKVRAEIDDAVRNINKNVQGVSDNDTITTGQSIEVFITEDETLNAVYQVRRGGYILMPRVGRIFLAGKKLSEAEQAIREALAVSQIKDATVMVERPSGTGASSDPVIYLAGEFKTPGAWKIPRDLSPTIVTTILRSGGLNDGADLTKVRLLRLVSGQAMVEEVNVQAILSGEGLPSDVTIQSGDIVMVPAFANSIYVTGNVMKAGAIKLLPDDELTVHSAILRAGGFSRFANRNKVFVLRDDGNGVKKKIPVSVRDLQAHGGNDLILKSKDIVVVPERFFSF